MTWQEHLSGLVDVLSTSPDVVPTVNLDPASTVFVGSGDSLSSALLAVPLGARAVSSGDLTWTGQIPVGAKTIVGISHSGGSAATVRALELARNKGLRVVAITSNAESPLANAADEVQLVPSLSLSEVVPVRSHIMLAMGVMAVCGQDVSGLSGRLAGALRGADGLVTDLLDATPTTVVNAASILSLPELRGAGDFWVLKFIEATGISARSVPLEESGHVDYFIGPEANLVVGLKGHLGAPRFARLAEALRSTGQTFQDVEIAGLGGEGASLGALELELLGATVGALFAEGAADRWQRPTFRGGAVNMDAAHIQLTPEVVTPH